MVAPAPPLTIDHSGHLSTTTGMEKGEPGGGFSHSVFLGGGSESSFYFMGQGGSRGGELSLLLRGWPGVGFPWGLTRFGHLLSLDP